MTAYEEFDEPRKDSLAAFMFFYGERGDLGVTNAPDRPTNAEAYFESAKLVRTAIAKMNERLTNPVQDIEPPSKQTRFQQLMHTIRIARPSPPPPKLWTADEVQTMMYDIGKEVYGKERLREFFRDTYLVLMAKTDGPRLGQLVEIMGVDTFLDQLNAKLDEHSNFW